jgi:ATP-binding cassette subfamily C protein CydCD
VVPAALTAAAIVLRGVLDFYRNMVAHHTAARVQTRLRQTLYDHIATLGPAHFTRSRTGDVILSMVEGIQQLEVYFGQYIPQLFVAALTPILIFAFVAFVDLPISLVFLVAALVTLVAPGAWHRMDRARSMERSRAYAAFGAEFLDSVQGLGTLKAYGQSATRGKLLQAKGKALFESTMGVLGTNTLARGITDTGIAVGAAGGPRLGRLPSARGGDGLRGARHRAHARRRGLPAAARAAHTAAPGHARHLRRPGCLRILDAEPLVSDGPAGAAGALEPTVTFEAVRFSYPGGRRPAHDGLSLAVRAGERVGIVGPSGSGKSTVARLLLRFYDPDQGRVLVGGRDVRELASTSSAASSRW